MTHLLPNLVAFAKTTSVLIKNSERCSYFRCYQSVGDRCREEIPINQSIYVNEVDSIHLSTNGKIMPENVNGLCHL